MKIKATGPKLPLLNYNEPSHEASFRKHGSLFGGESKTALIEGAGGSGKANIMISLYCTLMDCAFPMSIFIVNCHTNLNTNICATCWNL
nr:unnamed protein product [Callosobruchus analis]